MLFLPATAKNKHPALEIHYAGAIYVYFNPIYSKKSNKLECKFKTFKYF